MANALKGLTGGLIEGFVEGNPQLNSQASAITPVAYVTAVAIAEADSVVTIGTSKALTIARPRPGRILVITQVGAGTNTVTLGAGTYDGTNTIATFNAAADTLTLLGISDKRFLILHNGGAVAFS